MNFKKRIIIIKTVCLLNDTYAYCVVQFEKATTTLNSGTNAYNSYSLNIYTKYTKYEK